MSVIRRKVYTEQDVVVSSSTSGVSPFISLNGKLVNKEHPELEAHKISLAVIADNLKKKRQAEVRKKTPSQIENS